VGELLRYFEEFFLGIVREIAVRCRFMMFIFGRIRR
jgi:hypothetical protein